MSVPRSVDLRPGTRIKELDIIFGDFSTLIERFIPHNDITVRQHIDWMRWNYNDNREVERLQSTNTVYVAIVDQL